MGVKGKVEDGAQPDARLQVVVTDQRGWWPQCYKIIQGAGHWGVPNTAIPQKISTNTVVPQKKKIGKYRNTTSKVDEIPKSQKRGILFTLCSQADKNCVV